MQEILTKNRCTGCETCVNICPQNAICMTRDSKGFDYPYINQNLCIDCQLCIKFCPVIQYGAQQKKRHLYNDIQIAYAAKTTNNTDRKISSSGGIFPIIAKYILSNNGIIIGASFDKEFNVYHKIIKTKEALHFIQSSKYAQSSIGHVYRKIKDFLNAGNLVLFSGMACQVEGLKSYLRKPYENLYTIDLICMGIPSPGLWRDYLDTFFKDETIHHINFKDKTYGWRSFSLRIDTNKRTFIERGFDNAFFQCMFKTYSLRPSCFNCPFKKAERYSDFTLADCWGTISEVPELDDDKGLSSVIIHSQKGLNLWKDILPHIESSKVTIESIIRNNDNLIKNKAPHNKRKDFYDTYDKKGPKYTFNKYGKNPQKSIDIKIKKFLLTIFKVIKNKIKMV